LLPKWAKLPAADITRSDVKALLAKIDAPILSNQILASASAIFAWAIREEVAGIKVNPCAKIERNKTNSRERVMSNITWQRIKQIADDWLPQPKILLPWPQQRFAVRHSR
jgi:hypothetical protein